MFEMTEEECDECEQAERQKHDDKVKELVDFLLALVIAIVTYYITKWLDKKSK